MIVLRSAVFNAAFFAWTIGLLLGMWLLLPLPRRAMQEAVRLWARGVVGLLRGLVGIRYEIRGREHLPSGASVVACKHQSAWDTAIFYLLCDDPAYILKKELMRIPLWGWYARKARAIWVDRKAGARALRDMVRQAGERLRAGRTVVIFPEGTRAAPDGPRRPYHPGVAALYAEAQAQGVPLVPAAVNSGLFWGRRAFVKTPGTIVLELLPPMPEGLDRRAFLRELQDRVETATERLVEEGRRDPDGTRRPAA